MPAGNKSVLQVLVGPHMVQATTYTEEAELIRRIEQPAAESDNPDWHEFDGLNANDQAVIVKVRRGKIDGYVISPLVRMAVTPAQGRIVQ